MKQIWKDAVMGLIVGDAIGVPVEFKSRSELTDCPVEDIREYGTYYQPKGTWSDDSSMVLATMDSLSQGYDPADIMDKFVLWITKAQYTPFDEVFDKGISTYNAITNYMRDKDIFLCGGIRETDNGNGSLMRILPVCLYAYEQQKNCNMKDEEAIIMIHEVSALTHGHIRSLIACGLYFFMLRAILDGNHNLTECLQKGLDDGFAFYQADQTNPKELAIYDRLRDLEMFQAVSVDDIRSSGYVVDSLEAAIWSLVTTDTYRDCILKAVNLGNDTDTVAAIAGGLAGMFYGCDGIPDHWLAAIQKKNYIEELIDRM